MKKIVFKRKLGFIIVLMIALLTAVLLFACNKQGERRAEVVLDKYTTGKDISWNMVNEDENGLAYLNVAGRKYELGLDFLANAMVFNSQASNGLSEEEVFAKWYEWYNKRADFLQVAVMRGNQLFVSYQNVEGFEEYPLSTYRGFEQATHWVPTDSETLNIATDSIGQLWTRNASNLDWHDLIVGQGLLVTNDKGMISFNENVVASHSSTVSQDGKRQVTVTLKEGLKFSNDTPIKAENYLAPLLVYAANIYSINRTSYYNLAEKLEGFEAFSSYTSQTVFDGVKMPNDYTMVFTYDEKYVNYFWAEELLNLYPYPTEVYLGDKQLVTTERGIALPDSAYEKDGDGRYLLSKVIEENNEDISFATSGAYRIDNRDAYGIGLIANSDDVGAQYIRISSAKLPGYHVALENHISHIPSSNDELKITMYYQPALFQIRTVGPLASRSVRQALVDAFNWESIKDFFEYDEPTNYSLRLNDYWAGDVVLSSQESDIERAISLLEQDGWIYNADGTLYEKEVGGVRYKKIQNPTEQDYNYIEGKDIPGAGRSQSTQLEIVYLQDENCYLMPLLIRGFEIPTGTFEPVLPYNCADLGMSLDMVSTNTIFDDYANKDGIGGIYHLSFNPSIAYDMRGQLSIFDDYADALISY